ncbi:MAG TPA: phosphate ABC transporter substrate-binding protein [Syntrophorhabdaceae bacterium]|nr:phosphate ABC transporter substrate-binding protein [Syntrophorhabdaceae bacterium]HQM82377.1 phosphate ABC transporter substrate-binding protein [Syntrophorhabdaceae bacterium]
MKKVVNIFLSAVFFFALLGTCLSFADPLDTFKGEKGTVKIAGGTAHIPVMKEAARLIMNANPGIQITIAGGGSGVGIKQVGEGLVDIGNTGRKPTDEEIGKYDLKLFMWAVDGVALIVNPKNKVRSLSKAQAADIFSGKIDNWKALGGENRKINIYTRDEASGTREVFWEKAITKGAIAKSADVVVSNGAMKSAVSQDPYAIGYVSVGHIDKTVEPVSFDGVIPTIETVKSGKYTIARGLYSNTKGTPAPLTKKFLDFLYSAEGQKIITASGFIPVK